VEESLGVQLVVPEDVEDMLADVVEEDNTQDQ